MGVSNNRAVHTRFRTGRIKELSFNTGNSKHQMKIAIGFPLVRTETA